MPHHDLSDLVPARFLRRPNRFLAMVDLAGEEVQVHVADPGRLKELLVSGAEVFIRESLGAARKTRHTLVAVRHAGVLVTVNSLIPGDLVADHLGKPSWDRFAGARGVRREVPVGERRLDFSFRVGKETWYLEVKGCSLVREGQALFPDAPTRRGAAHLDLLLELAGAGFRAGVVFVVQRPDAARLSPNGETDPRFAGALRRALAGGVVMCALTTRAVPGRLLELVGEIPVEPWSPRDSGGEDGKG